VWKMGVCRALIPVTIGPFLGKLTELLTEPPFQAHSPRQSVGEMGEGVRMGIVKPINNEQQPRSRGRPKKTDSSRLHISIPDSLVSRLQELQRDTHASSLTEVVKAALQLYAAAVEEHKNGGGVYFKRKDGEGGERQLALFI